jgi:dethiobiotin synthetase
MSNRTAPTRGLFVTATDTGVGKTHLTALIARSLIELGVRVGAYKPVCSGAEVAADGAITWNDVTVLSEALGGGVDAQRICPLRLQAPLAPPVAARLESKRIDFQSLVEGTRWWNGRVEVLLVEGVGGLLCPLTETQTIADLAVALGYPLLIVTRLGLGTINHTLLTIEAARTRGLKIRGIVFNEAEPLPPEFRFDENPTEIASRTNVRVLGIVRHGGTKVQPFDVNNRPLEWERLI